MLGEEECGAMHQEDCQYFGNDGWITEVTAISFNDCEAKCEAVFPCLYWVFEVLCCTDKSFFIFYLHLPGQQQ